MGLFSFLFSDKSNQIKDYLQKGSFILDVRTQREWDARHIDKAIHIPLDELNERIDEIKNLNQPIITCCASGMRSAKATKILNLNTIDAINGANWVSLQSKL
jgi:phage shock protein E